jgi:hypothetical protein
MTQQIKLLPLPNEEWDESIAHIKKEMKGRPLKVHGLMANHPQLLKAWWNFRNYSVQGGDLGPRKAELVILRVALHMKAWYEWASIVIHGMYIILGCMINTWGLELDPEVENKLPGSICKDQFESKYLP